MTDRELIRTILWECEEALREREKAPPSLERHAANQLLTVWRLRFERIKESIGHPWCSRCEEAPSDGSRIMCAKCWAETGEPIGE
jgi:hypothetical protein